MDMFVVLFLLVGMGAPMDLERDSATPLTAETCIQYTISIVLVNSDSSGDLQFSADVRI